MSRPVSGLPHCKACGGKLVPFSLCEVCGEASIVRDAKEVDRTLPCPACGAVNPSQLLCESCHARTPVVDLLGAPRAGNACPSCATFLEPGTKTCPACGKQLLPPAERAPPPKDRRKRRIRGSGDADRLRDLQRATGLSEDLAQALLDRGYTTVSKLAGATLEELAAVPGLGTEGALEVRGSVESFPSRTQESLLEEEFDCPLCHCVTSAFALACLDCGVVFEDEEDLDAEARARLLQEGERGLLSFYDLRLEDDPADPELWYARGLLLESMGRNGEAMRSLDRAAALAPGKRKVVLATARVLSKVSKEAGASDRLRSMFQDLVADITLDEEMTAFERSLGSGRAVCPFCDEPLPAKAVRCPACSMVVRRSAVRQEEAPREEADLKRLDTLLEDLETPATLDTMVDRLEQSLSPKDLEQLRGATLDWLMEELEESITSPPLPPPQEAPKAVEKPRAPPVPAHVSTPRGFLSRSRFSGRRGSRGIGQVNGLGRVNGLTNGRGRVNGFVNGQGRVNGLVNGLGRVNGLTNGKGRVNGLTNGRGRVNGFVNGRGFVNGAGLTLVQRPAPSRSLLVGVLGTIVAAVALFAVLFLPTFSGPAAPIQIDGQFGDWSSVPAFDIATTSADPSADLSRFASLLTADSLYLYASTRGPTFGDLAGYDGVYFLLDSDGNASTGFWFQGLGADYVLEAYGTNGTVTAAHLNAFPADAELNWSRAIGGPSVPAAASSQGLEVRVPRFEFAELVVDAYRIGVYATNFNGASSRGLAALSHAGGAVLLETRSLAQVVGTGPADLLEIRIRAMGLAAETETWTVSSIQLNTTPGITVSLSAESVNLTRAEPSAAIRVAVSAPGFFPGDVIEVGLLGATAPRPVTVVGDVVRAYVGAPPSGKRVDGLFADWSSGAVVDTDPAPVNNSDVDIVREGAATNGTAAFFYVQVAGALLEGSMPQKILRIQGSGGGGGGSPSPIPAPRRTGEDVLRAYVDLNVSDSRGTAVGGILADYLFEVRGEGGRFTAEALFRWNGTWRKVPSPAVALAKNVSAIEGSLGIGPLTNETRMVFATTDWTGIGDSPVPPVPLSTLSKSSVLRIAGIQEIGILSGTGYETVLAKPLANLPSVDGSCGTTTSEYSGADMKSKANLKFFIGTRPNLHAVFVCVEVTSDVTNDGTSDYGQLLFDGSHDASATPQANDRRFRVASGGSLASSKGDGSGWVDCGASCGSGNSAVGNYNGTSEVYEFNITYSDVWGTDTPATNEIAGFAILVFDATGGLTYTWGATDVSETAPNTWGDLEIPEFPEVASVCLAVLGLALLFRRRRRS